jgi:hypothetical protein
MLPLDVGLKLALEMEAGRRRARTIVARELRVVPMLLVLLVAGALPSCALGA